LGSQNVLEVNGPVLIVRPDDGPIGPKHVDQHLQSQDDSSPLRYGQ